jgi:hypothetical protein
MSSYQKKYIFMSRINCFLALKMLFSRVIHKPVLIISLVRLWWFLGGFMDWFMSFHYVYIVNLLGLSIGCREGLMLLLMCLLAGVCQIACRVCLILLQNLLFLSILVQRTCLKFLLLFCSCFVSLINSYTYQKKNLRRIKKCGYLRAKGD